ncbi:MAG: Gfo/Idh/MocA family oxidoreductase [Chitinophagales bacterium]|nr:Gfo/Idh/MocA family oxidoreductase [Chitinophagales bacterium]MDW8428374.1 Gfo/Idh/MocA family oxidoreductase [Chitinophagales bacterium]
MIKIGVIGAGHLGKIHIKLIREISQLQLVGFYDIDVQRAELIQKELGALPFESAEALLQAVDAVDIVSPTSTHYPYALMALRQGKHVFVEKPLASTAAEAAELTELAREAGTTAMVGHVERFNPAFLSVKRYLRNPMFIEAHRLAQFNPRGTDVPVVMDLMIHDIDLVRHVVAVPLKRIHASGVAVLSASPDIANVRLEFNNGCVANLTASRISLKQMRKMRLFQPDGYISVDFLDKKSEIIRLSDHRDSANPFALEVPVGNHSRWLTFERPTVLPLNAIKLELEQFAQAIANQSDPPVSFMDGLEALQIATEIMRQIELVSPARA